MISIINYGLGNLGSISNMIRKVGGQSKIVSSPVDLQDATKIILPGVGAFDTGISHLHNLGMLDVLNTKALIEKVPILGICLGAQLMTRSSDEGELPGLGWFDAVTVKFNFSHLNAIYPLPNIGWRDTYSKNESILLNGFHEIPRFYYVHSYYLKSDNQQDISMSTNYGFEYSAGLSKNNIHCVQFHPEKSHKFGMQLFRNFLAIK